MAGQYDDAVLQAWVDAVRNNGVKNSMNKFVGDGVKTVYDINFAGGYLNKADILAYKVSPTNAKTDVAVTAVNDNKVTIDAPVEVGWTLVIYRDTPKSFPLVDFADNSIINEKNLDTNFKQTVFGVAELLDRFDDTVTFTLDAYAAAERAKSSENAAAASAAAAAASAASALSSANTASTNATATAADRATVSSSAQQVAANTMSAAASAGTAVQAANTAAGAAESALASAASATASAASAASSAALAPNLGPQGIVLADKVITGFDATGLQNNAWVHFAGRDTVGDGGGGQFRYSATSTQTADGVYVFAPAGGGRLFRDGWSVFGFSGTTYAAWSGADTAADPTNAIQNLANAAAGNPIRLTNDKLYTLSKQITIPSTGLVIDGNDMDSCGFSYSGSFDLFVGAGSVGNLLPSVRLSNLIVKKTGGTTGQLFKLTLAETPLLTSVRFDGANGANPAYLMLLGCKYAGIASCKFTGGASAFWGSSDMTATGVWGESNTAFKCVADTPRQGFNVTYQRDFTGLMCSSFGASSTYGCGWVIEYENNGVNIAFCDSHNNVRAAFYVEGNVAFGCQNITFTGCIGYANGECGVNLDANFRNVSINGGAYYGNTGSFAAATGHGIMGAGSRYVRIGGAVSVYGNAGSGIWYTDAFDLKIGDVNLRDNAKYGIDLLGTKSLIRISSQTAFSNNTLGTVNGWTYFGNNEWQGGPWEPWTPTFYKQNETTPVAFSTLSARWRRDDGKLYYDVVAATPSSPLDGYTFFSIPEVGAWPDNSSGSQALLPRGFASMDVSGTQSIDGAFANDKLRITKTAAGDTTIRASGNCDV